MHPAHDGIGSLGGAAAALVRTGDDEAPMVGVAYEHEFLVERGRGVDEPVNLAQAGGGVAGIVNHEQGVGDDCERLEHVLHGSTAGSRC